MIVFLRNLARLHIVLDRAHDPTRGARVRAEAGRMPESLEVLVDDDVAEEIQVEVVLRAQKNYLRRTGEEKD